MPVEREGRMVEAQPDKLNQWLGRVSHEPVQIATETLDLSAELQRGLAFVRHRRRRAGRRQKTHERNLVRICATHDIPTQVAEVANK